MRLFVAITLAAMAPLMLAAPSAQASEYVAFEVFSGVVYNFPTPLTITEEGERDISLTAQYETESFQEAPYYGLRLGLWDGKKGWEIEMIHHKIKLTNGPEEVDHFEVSHGYNLLTINRAWEHEMGFLHLGAGFMFSHPELTLRGKEREHDEAGIISDRNISGPTIQISAGRRYRFSEKIYGILEGKFTATYANIAYEDGNMFAPNVAIHIIFGIGFDYSLDNPS